MACFGLRGLSVNGSLKGLKNNFLQCSLSGTLPVVGVNTILIRQIQVPHVGAVIFRTPVYQYVNSL